MRAGGPFAPGSIIGAVTADTHRRTSQGTMGVLSPHGHSPSNSPTTQSQQAFASSAAPSLTFPLSAVSRKSTSAAGAGQSTAVDDDATSHRSFHSAVDTVACSLSEDARQAFNDAGVSPRGGNSSPNRKHHHHVTKAQKVSPLKPLQQHAAAAYAHAMEAKDRAFKFVRELSRRGLGSGKVDTSSNAEDIERFLSHSSHPAVDAFRSGKLGFGFSGGGFLFPWHLGVVTELQDAGIITKDTQLSGASCGSIIVACVHSGLNLHSLVKELLSFAEDCRANGTAGRLRYVIEHFMTANLPHDAHHKCAGKTHIQMTRVFPYLKVMSVSEWSSKDDLVQAIACSCHIPAYNDGSLVFRYRGSLFVDGGVLKHLPVPPKVAFSAGVSCVPLKFLNKLPGANRLSVLRGLAISPDMFSDFPFEWQQLASLVLVPGPDPVLISMIERGKADARRWAEATGITAYQMGSLFVPRAPSKAAYAGQAGDEEDDASEYEEAKEEVAPMEEEDEKSTCSTIHEHHTRLHRHKEKSRRRPKGNPQRVEVVGGLGVEDVSEQWDEELQAYTAKITSSSEQSVSPNEKKRSIKIRVKGIAGQPDMLLDILL